MRLDQCVVVITGSSGGLGKAIAEAMTRKGAAVVLSSNNSKELARASKELKALAVKADVTRQSDLDKVAQKTISSYGRIDLWINNAGLWLPKEPLETVDLRKAKKLFSTNIMGTIHGMRAAVRVMKKQGFGTIANVISTTAFDGMNGSSGSIYVTSKYALRGLTNVVRDELAAQAIRVIGIYPGGIKTGLFDAAKPRNFGAFMPVGEVADKIVAHMEKNSPDLELIIARPGQKMPAGRR